MLDLRLRAYEPGTDTTLGFLPEPLSVEASFVHNNDGALTVKYSRLADCGAIAGRTLNQGLDVEVEVSWGGGWQAVPNGRFLMVNRDVDPTDPARLVTLTFVSWGWLLNKVCDLNTAALAGSKSKYAGKRVFSATRDAGDVVKTMLDEHDARSGPVVPILRDSWDASHDSGGSAWLRKLGRNTDDRTFPAGQPLHAKMDAFVRSGLCDYRTVGRALRMYNQNSASVDRSALVRLAWGDDLTDAPSTESQADRVARLLVKGDGKHKETVMDPSVPEHYGRWEGMLDAAGVKDDDDLEDMGQAELADRNRIKGEYTRTLTMSGTFLPFRDYSFGDWVTAPTADGDAKLRVMQITITRSEQGGLSGNVILGDRFTNADLALAGRVSAITGGTTGVIGNGTTVTTPPQDTRQPAAPTGLTVTGELYLNPFGEWKVRGRFSWTPTTLATDGTALDVARYEVLGQEQTTPASEWRAMSSTSGNFTDLTIEEFRVASSWLFTVRAYGVSTTEPGVQSATASITFGTDTTPPNQPATPTVTSYLGALVVSWTGLDSGGAAMPLDYDHCEVHLSTTSGFTPSSATLKASFTNRRPSTGGTVTLAGGLTYGTTYYVRLRAYDMSGNASTVSVQASGVPQRAVTDDIAQAAIDSIVKDSVEATLTSANGLNTVIYRTTDPATISGYTPKAGDTWFKTSGTTIIGQWQYTGSAWSAVTLSHETISSLDAGVITSGFIDVDRLAGRAIGSEKLFIGAYDNLVTNAGFEWGTTGPHLLAAGSWTLDGTYYRSGSASARFTVPAATSADTEWIYLNGPLGDVKYHVPCSTGQEFYFEAWVQLRNGTAGQMKVGLKFRNAAGSLIGQTNGTATTLSGWTKLTVSAAAPAGAAYVVPVIIGATGWSAGAQFIVDDLFMRQKNVGEIIVDGGVTANHMSATDIFLINLFSGPTTGTHVRITPDGGFTAWAANPANANAIENWFRAGDADSGDGLSIGFDSTNPDARISAAGHLVAQSVTTGALRVGGNTLGDLLDRLPKGRLAFAESTSPVTGISTTETGVMELRAVMQPGRTYSIAAENIALSSSAGAAQVRQGIRYALDGAAVSTSSTALRLNATDYVHPSGVYIGQPDVNATINTGAWSAAREIRLLYTVWLYSGSGTVNVWGGTLQPLTLTIRDEGPAIAATTTAKLWTSVWNCSGMYRNGAGSVVTSVQVYDPGTSVFAHGLFNGTAISGEATTVATAMSGATLIKAEIGTYVSKSLNGDFGWFLNPSTATAATATISSPAVNAESAGQVAPSSQWHDVSSAWTTSSRSIHLSDPNLVSRTLLNTTAHPLQLRLTYLR